VAIGSGQRCWVANSEKQEASRAATLGSGQIRSGMPRSVRPNSAEFKIQKKSLAEGIVITEV